MNLNNDNDSNDEYHEDEYHEDEYHEDEYQEDKSFKSKLYYEIKDYFENVKNKYINDKVLINTIDKLFKEIPKGQINRCLECNIDMGECNPRQLCGKWHCTNS